ncbi:MAG: gamma-glutamyltransferase [Rhodothalassiaceae bacterium]
MRRHLPLLFAVLALLLPAAARAGAPAHADHYMISSANPHASAAGLAMLRAGGSAVDAAIAAQAVLSLVEPQSSGIGGGGFLLHYDAAAGDLVAYDGRETAPMAADETLFLDDNGETLPFLEAALGGRAVGVPGVLAMLERAHRAHGRLPWADLFVPAIRLAEAGFAISPRLHALLARRAGRYRKMGLHLADLGTAGSYFFVEDANGLRAKETGTRLRNPDYAATLRAIAAGGADAFYRGPLARAMVAAVHDNPFSVGTLSLADLAAYRARATDPVCGAYRRHWVCSMGPPSSGATTLLAILGILEGFDMPSLAPQSAEAVHLFAEASELAYADRDEYTADAAFFPVPVAGLIDRNYLAERRRLIRRDRAMGRAPAGIPPGWDGPPPPQEEAAEGPSTSHLVVADAAGNVVSFTTTVQIAFGSFLISGGFILNNQLTDFSFAPEREGRKRANRVEPGKRPRSSMTPTIAFDAAGRPVLAVGSPGGGRIIDYVAKAVIAVLDWKMDMQAAIDLPNMVARNGVLELEAGTRLADLAPALAAMGHTVRQGALESGLHGIRIRYRPDGSPLYEGGADPRREGIALGD